MLKALGIVFAAAVYGASEGLDVLVVESNLPGGQAGSSSSIEPYLGFPAGISGFDLTGSRTRRLDGCVALDDCCRLRSSGAPCVGAV